MLVVNSLGRQRGLKPSVRLPGKDGAWVENETVKTWEGEKQGVSGRREALGQGRGTARFVDYLGNAWETSLAEEM